ARKPVERVVVVAQSVAAGLHLAHRPGDNVAETAGGVRGAAEVLPHPVEDAAHVDRAGPNGEALGEATENIVDRLGDVVQEVHDRLECRTQNVVDGLHDTHRAAAEATNHPIQ